MQNASLAPTPTTNSTSQSPAPQALPTFLDHIHELRRRLFWVVAVVLVVSAVSYGFLNDIIGLLTAPLGDKQLYYLTPAGGLTFAFKLCSFIGLLVGVPVLMYHLYRFLEPLMGTKRKSALFYVGLSTLFAAAGAAFAYFISLPAALHFLTNFNLGNVQAMLTVDSYLSFVVTYLLGAALLFQIPLLLLIINTMTPLKPSKLMKLQKFVIVGAFIVAAIISPTPDIMNQAFLAIPIIGMYQLGVLLVWWQQTASAHKTRRQARRSEPAMPRFELETPDAINTPAIPTEIIAELVQPQPEPQPIEPVSAAQPRLLVPQPVKVVARRPQRLVVDISPRTLAQAAPVRPVRTPAHMRTFKAQAVRPAAKLAVPTRSVDGFMRPSPATST
jgi:sec-independent protein translocase protein TatC